MEFCPSQLFDQRTYSFLQQNFEDFDNDLNMQNPVCDDYGVESDSELFDSSMSNTSNFSKGRSRQRLNTPKSL